MKFFLNERTSNERMDEQLRDKLTKFGFTDAELDDTCKIAQNFLTMLKKNTDKLMSAEFSKRVTASSGKTIEIIAQTSSQQSFIRRILSL